MPRKAKEETAEPVVEGSETPPQPAVMPTPTVRKVAKKSASRKTRAKKSSGTRTKRKTDESAEPTERRDPTDDEIRLRAYFIAERRVQMGIAGSEHDDWIEARRQLQAELGG